MPLNYSHFLTTVLIASTALFIVEGIKDEKPKNSVEEIPDDFIESFGEYQRGLLLRRKNYWPHKLYCLEHYPPDWKVNAQLTYRRERLVSKRNLVFCNRLNFSVTPEMLTAEAQRRNLVGEWFNVEEIPGKYNGKYPLEEGDMLEIKRKMGKIKYPVKHWAIYMGDGKIISLRQIKDKDDGDKVIAQICENVIADSRYKDNWMRKNNILDLYFSRFEKQVILERARAKVGCKYDYKILYWNCENFVNLVVYDKIFSIQAAHYSKHRLSAKVVQEIENMGLLK